MKLSLACLAILALVEGAPAPSNVPLVPFVPAPAPGPAPGPAYPVVPYKYNYPQEIGERKAPSYKSIVPAKRSAQVRPLVPFVAAPAPALVSGPAYPTVPLKYNYPQDEERKARSYRGKRSPCKTPPTPYKKRSDQ